jgi:hypothetical protein
MFTYQQPHVSGRVPRERFRRFRFFTLAEALIAFAATMVVLSGAMALFKFYGWLDHELDSRNAAVTVAQSRIEALRALEFADLVLAGESDTGVDLNGSPAPDGALFRSTVVVPDAVDPIVTVTVSVRVAGKLRYPEQTVSLTTYIMDRTLVTNLQ